VVSLVLPGAGNGEVGQREHREGDVGIPRPPGPDLVVIQPGLVLRGLEALLDRPPRPGHPDRPTTPTAIEQLGDDKVDIRLGGIYALERIAVDSEQGEGAENRPRGSRTSGRRAPVRCIAAVVTTGRRAPEPPGGGAARVLLLNPGAAGVDGGV
jgi:hypothetical protein